MWLAAIFPLNNVRDREFYARAARGAVPRIFAVARKAAQQRTALGRLLRHVSCRPGHLRPKTGKLRLKQEIQRAEESSAGNAAGERQR